jgi:hypothetical protein
MKCQSCDCLLSDFETTRKHAITGAYLDLCNKCFKDIPVLIPTIDRKDLIKEEEIDDDYFENNEDDFSSN